MAARCLGLGWEELAPRWLPSAAPPDHVVVVVEENHPFTAIRGSPDAAYLNALADGPHAALLTQSFAVEHPSQPNYLDLFSGSNQGVTSDAVPAAAFATPNLGASLRAAGRTFVGYSEGLPAAGSLVTNAGGSGGYWRKHNPWADWQGGRANGLPADTNQPFSSFPTDFAQLPTVAFVVPDQANDMHDGTIATADGWLRDNLGGYAAWAVAHNSLLVVTFDEDDDTAGNRVFTLLVGASVAGGNYAGRVDHFGLLRTIEDLYGLPAVGASATAAPAAVWAESAAGAAFAVGADAGGEVAYLRADGTTVATVQPFGAFTAGVRVATADFNGDGIPDLVAGTGPGVPTQVRVLDGATQGELFSLQPFEASFTGGVFVAAGDITGDGLPDLVITPDEGGGPRVDVYSGAGFAKVVSFFGIDDPNFRGGARAAVGDVTGDGRGDLIVAAGFGGGPRVSVYDGAALTAGQRVHPVGDFFAFESTLRNGVYLAIGDVDGDGANDLVFGAGPGGGPRTLVVSGRTLLQQGPAAAFASPIANFFAADPANRDGIRVTVKNLDGDAKADIVTGAGGRTGNPVAAYLGKALATAVPFDLGSGFLGGVFVG